MMQTIVVFLFCLFALSQMAFGAPVTTTTTSLDSLEKRVEDLERRQQETFEQLNQSNGYVRPFLKSGILLGGYFETAISHVNGPNTKSQYSANSHLVGLNLGASFTDSDRFVMQLQTGLGYTFNNAHNDPDFSSPKQRQFGAATAPTVLTQAYYEHGFTPLLNLQLGLGYVPYGQAYQKREPFLQKRRGGAQMLNSASSLTVGVAFPLFMGAHLHGAQQFGELRSGYHLYTFSPSTDSKSIGAGSRLWLTANETVTFGFSHQIGTVFSNTYQSYGADLDVIVGNLGLTLEYAENDPTGKRTAPRSYYASPYIELFKGKLILYGLADYLDNPTQLSGSTADPYKVWTLGGGINWLPLTTTRIRLGYFHHDYVGGNAVKKGQDRDSYTMDLSLILAF